MMLVGGSHQSVADRGRLPNPVAGSYQDWPARRLRLGRGGFVDLLVAAQLLVGIVGRSGALRAGCQPQSAGQAGTLFGGSGRQVVGPVMPATVGDGEHRRCGHRAPLPTPHRGGLTGEGTRSVTLGTRLAGMNGWLGHSLPRRAGFTGRSWGAAPSPQPRTGGPIVLVDCRWRRGRADDRRSGLHPAAAVQTRNRSSMSPKARCQRTASVGRAALPKQARW